MKKKISIIVPIYNVEAYINDCLHSISNQTIDGCFECILVDDCGQDNSMKIVSEFLANYNGPISFIVIHRHLNGGLSAARNTGIEKSSGEFLFFLDSDDYLEPDCIEQLLCTLDKYPDSDIVQGGAKTTDGSLDWLNFEKTSKPDSFDYDNGVASKLMDTLSVPITAWNKLISSRLMRCNNITFKEGIIHEDELFAFQLARYAKKVAFCKHNTYNYRIRPNSIMTKTALSKKYDSWLTILDTMINSIDENIKKAQIEKIQDLSNDLYFRYDNPEFRKGIARIKKQLSHVCPFPLSAKLYLWGALAGSRFGKSPIAYYWLYQTTRKDSIPIIIKDVLKRSFA